MAEITIERLRRYRRTYYKINKTRITSWKKDYREKNKERLNAYARKYRLDHKELLSAKKRRYYELNMVKLADQQRIIFAIRQEQGLSLREMGKKIGVCHQTVSLWEKGKMPCNWELLETVFPGIQERSKA